ncbi:MAG: 50S ribosomal protein L29 [Phycisphaerales bacterium]
MDGKEVRGLSDEEIGAELKRLRARLFTLGTQAVTEKVEDNSQFTKVRRDIARLMTERTRRAAPTGPAPKAAPTKKAPTRTAGKAKTAAKAKK